MLTKEKCIQCFALPVIEDSFLCEKCFNEDILFFYPRFQMVNDLKLLAPDKLKQFNESPYYLKRFFIQNCIKKGLMI